MRCPIGVGNPDRPCRRCHTGDSPAPRGCPMRVGPSRSRETKLIFAHVTATLHRRFTRSARVPHEGGSVPIAQNQAHRPLARHRGAPFGVGAPVRPLNLTRQSVQPTRLAGTPSHILSAFGSLVAFLPRFLVVWWRPSGARLLMSASRTIAAGGLLMPSPHGGVVAFSGPSPREGFLGSLHGRAPAFSVALWPRAGLRKLIATCWPSQLRRRLLTLSGTSPFVGLLRSLLKSIAVTWPSRAAPSDGLASFISPS
jgi:hypothetical protein